MYSLAYGDQPALICELVDWARATGFEVVCAGKGTKYLPEYHASTPDTVWDHYGFTDEQVAAGGLNAGCSTPSSTGQSRPSRWPPSPTPPVSLLPPRASASRPPGPTTWPPSAGPATDGGSLHHAGQVEVVSSLERDGRPVARDLRWGVYVTFEAPTEYAARCFSRVRARDRRLRALHGAVPAVPPDRARARHQRRPAALRGEATGRRPGSGAMWWRRPRGTWLPGKSWTAREATLYTGVSCRLKTPWL